VQYITDTLPGSSGSPVFNDDWRIVALHHSGGNIPEPSTNSIHFRNEGIRIGAILADLPPLN
jgi:V8-like Glu-specific endopeptidase